MAPKLSIIQMQHLIKRKISELTKLRKAGLEMTSKANYSANSKHCTYHYGEDGSSAINSLWAFMVGASIPVFADRFICIFCWSKQRKELGTASPCFRKQLELFGERTISVKTDHLNKLSI